MNKDERALLRTVGTLSDLPAAAQLWVLRRLTVPEKRTLDEFWLAWAHAGQLAPRRRKTSCAGEAANAPAVAGAQGAGAAAAAAAAPWLILGGRGFGKTRAGAEWVSGLARALGPVRIALVGATIEDAINVMVTGRSGLLAVARTGEAVVLNRSQRVVRFASGAEAFLYSGACPEKLRGPEHHFAWCDEIAKWRHGEAAWDNLQLGLRLGLPTGAAAGFGAGPRALVTTTPRATALVQRLMLGAQAAGTLAQGRMADNLNLPPGFVAAMEAAYRGTRQGREELDGELVWEAEGALWTRALLERCRVERVPPPGPLHEGVEGEAGRGAPPPSAFAGGDRGVARFRRIVIGVDPPASAAGDACGIVACGVDAGGIGHVLGDHSASGLSPEGWASAVVAAARAWGADCVIVEKNQGGDMVKSVLHAADRSLPVRDVFARYGKGDRAEPVAMLFEAGRVMLAGSFPALEDELCALTRGGGWAGPGRSPDRADACVWALTELLLGKERVTPRVSGF